MAATEAKHKRIDLTGISKAFPGVLANDKVSFSVMPGEIHALLGENGAGKSTLVKMIYGVMQPDEGSIAWNGRPVTIASPREARRLGIGMVFQHFSLFEALTVLENIALGMDGSIATSKLEARIRQVLDTYGLKLDPHRVVSTLSVGERQRIEIVRALLLEPSLLIMDEPTSVLTPQEVAQLFETLRQLSATGCSILYISHKLHEIRELCDTATILRGGRVVATCDPQKETPKSLAEMMIGTSLQQLTRTREHTLGDVRFAVSGLSLPGEGDFGVTLSGISFDVRAGEIFGIAGVAGNGQNELLQALSGERTASPPDAISLDGQPVANLTISGRRARGLGAVPEERNGHGAVADFTLAENTLLTGRRRMGLAHNGVIDTAGSTRFADKIIAGFDVKATGPEALAGSLSGGNLQKFIMGREILQQPDVLVVSQPTWGVDAGAAAAIHQALADLAAQGSAIVVISQDLDELMSLCDRLAVINEGQLSRSLDVSSASIDEIGLLMGGVHGDPAATAEFSEGSHAH
jgi:ABC-type uncharacterized transport system ATPase subunit